MIRYAVLGSGSNGNSYIIESDGAAILLDAGFSLKQIRQRCELSGFDPSRIIALFITHLHPDHARGAGVFARQMKQPVFFHQEIGDAIREFRNLRIPSELHRALGLQEVMVGPFTVSSFATHHDSPHSQALRVRVGGRTFVLLTDTGKVSDDMAVHASESDVLFLEANYDESMLANGPYPYYLKRRISGDEGHLSNEVSIDFLNTLTHNNDRDVYFCHLSLENNSPEVLRASLEQKWKQPGSYTICENGKTYSGLKRPQEETV